MLPNPDEASVIFLRTFESLHGAQWHSSHEFGDTDDRRRDSQAGVDHAIDVLHGRHFVNPQRVGSAMEL